MGKLTAVLGAAAVVTLGLVQPWEGRSLRAYLDPISIPTICDGITKGVRLGQVATHAECDQMLVEELIRHDRDMMACVRVPLNPNQRAAFLSFTYNVGAKNFCSSTLNRKLNAGDYRGACAELSRWTMAGGRELRGLVRRRAAERQVCES